MSTAKTQELDKVVIKFAGDSGDGMQLTGSQFTDTSALLGNDLATFPDYPAEIRAPQGTTFGVSGFQVHIGNVEINTPGDIADVLIAMNAAALKVNLTAIRGGATIIVDIDNFKHKDLEKAHFDSDPLEDGTLDGYNVIEAPITTLTREVLKDSGLDGKSVLRCKNMFALGIVYWMFNRPLEYTEHFLDTKFIKNPDVANANKKVLVAGYHYAETIEVLASNFVIPPAQIERGVYRNIMGNQATAWGLLAASEKSGRKLFLGSYPITPATDILHELSKYKQFGAKIVQAEDEIAGICIAIGASFAGSLAVTTTSGPGLALKSEAIGLAIMAELPLVIVNVQRGGPSTGLPTKTEQADLIQAVYGRNGESPAIVMAASTPSDCFDFAFMAAKISVEHMTPVILLTDGYLGNGSEPWKIPNMKSLPDITPPILKEGVKDWEPYERDAERMARLWALPGTPGYEHRIGGLEKDFLTGDVSYVPENHEKMVRMREEKVQHVANFIPELEVYGKHEGDLLVVGWGGTYGSLRTAVSQMGTANIAHAHFNYIKPLPKNTLEVFGRYSKIVVCELNLGQFTKYLRGIFPEITFMQYNKIQGLPFTTDELTTKFKEIIAQ
ncbi:MAG TPA: 2-oxoacid:acceptor oxidoreductase subunit alpha [Flavobacteriales bacterium]|nr:2-oxoacid:acceptor oxidoreductase subunit alpha [Flavobacteriales bacterium]